MEKRVGAQAKVLGDVTGEAWAEIARAGADEKGVEVAGLELGLGEGGAERAGGEIGAFGAEDGVQFIGAAVENFFDVRRGEVTSSDAVVAAQDAVEDEARAFMEARADGGIFHDIPALALGECCRRDRGC